MIEFPQFSYQRLWTFQRSRCIFDLWEREKSNSRLKNKIKCSISHLLQALRFTLQPIWRAKSQTVTAGFPVWLRWEGHNLSSVPSRSRANTARRTTGAPVSTSCLCWPTVTLHPSEVTPAPLHKVNLPLKIWYLLTCLIECDGCMTFIEFFYKWVQSGLWVPRMLSELNPRPHSWRCRWLRRMRIKASPASHLLILVEIKV